MCKVLSDCMEIFLGFLLLWFLAAGDNWYSYVASDHKDNLEDMVDQGKYDYQMSRYLQVSKVLHNVHVPGEGGKEGSTS